MSPSFDHIALLGPQPACRVPQAHSGLAIFFLVAPVVTDSSVPLASRRPPVAPAVQPERWLTVTGCQSRVAPAVTGSTQPHAGRRMSAAPPSVPTVAHGPLDAPKVQTVTVLYSTVTRCHSSRAGPSRRLSESTPSERAAAIHCIVWSRLGLSPATRHPSSALDPSHAHSSDRPWARVCCAGSATRREPPGLLRAVYCTLKCGRIEETPCSCKTSSGPFGVGAGWYGAARNCTDWVHGVV